MRTDVPGTSGVRTSTKKRSRTAIQSTASPALTSKSAVAERGAIGWMGEEEHAHPPPPGAPNICEKLGERSFTNARAAFCSSVLARPFASRTRASRPSIGPSEPNPRDGTASGAIGPSATRSAGSGAAPPSRRNESVTARW